MSRTLDGSGTAAVPPPKPTDPPTSGELLDEPVAGELELPRVIDDEPPSSDPAMARPLASGLPDASEAAMVTMAELVAVPPITSAFWMM